MKGQWRKGEQSADDGPARRKILTGKTSASRPTKRDASSNVSLESVFTRMALMSSSASAAGVTVTPERRASCGAKGALAMSRRRAAKPQGKPTNLHEAPARVEHGLERAQAPVVVLLRGQELRGEREDRDDHAPELLGRHEALRVEDDLGDEVCVRHTSGGEEEIQLKYKSHGRGAPLSGFVMATGRKSCLRLSGSLERPPCKKMK